jgi:hypothetical protein
MSLASMKLVEDLWLDPWSQLQLYSHVTFGFPVLTIQRSSLR